MKCIGAAAVVVQVEAIEEETKKKKKGRVKTPQVEKMMTKNRLQQSFAKL